MPVPHAAAQRTDFNAALGKALRYYIRPDKLVGNGLLKLTLVHIEAGHEGDPFLYIAALRRILSRRIGALADSPQTAIYQRVLDTAYLHPAADQHRAAKSLGLDYSAYRHHLGVARRLLATRLWAQEQACTDLKPANGQKQ